MAIFNSYVSLPEGNLNQHQPFKNLWDGWFLRNRLFYVVIRFKQCVCPDLNVYVQISTIRWKGIRYLQSTGYALVFKRRNGRYTVYRWLSHWTIHLPGFPIFFLDFPWFSHILHIKSQDFPLVSGDFRKRPFPCCSRRGGHRFEVCFVLRANLRSARPKWRFPFRHRGSPNVIIHFGWWDFPWHKPSGVFAVPPFTESSKSALKIIAAALWFHGSTHNLWMLYVYTYTICI